MNAQISASSLPAIQHGNIPCITTDLLAQVYGTEVVNIQVNHARNRDRFIEGKHFFKLEGIELKEFKNRLTESKPVAKHARSLILWTERGAARHAKMLETDQAWEVFEKLEDCYFSQKEKHPTPVTKPANTEERYHVRVMIYDNLFGGCVEMLGKGDTFRAIANGIATDLGYKPHAFTHVGANKEKMKRIH